MNWVVFCVLMGLAFFNLLGVGIYHYQWKHDKYQHKDWKCKEFYLWTAYLILFGTTYCVLLFILWVKSLFSK